MENVKDTKEAKTRVVLINQIIDRAAELGIMYSSRLSHSMDINYAVQVFDIDLKAWLDSTNNDFIHDYVGIYKNIDRDAISSKHFASKNDFGTFVPRFARNENNLIKELKCIFNFQLARVNSSLIEITSAHIYCH